MSIEINGVTIPDLPADVLAQYPYVLIFQANTTKDSTEYLTTYYATCAKGPIAYIPSELTHYASLTGVNGMFASDVLGDATCEYVVGESAWTVKSTEPNSEIIGTIDGAYDNAGLYFASYPKWTNHTIYVADTYDSSTKPDTYTLTDKVYTPGMGIMNSLDDYPPIPDDLSYSYPYVAVGEIVGKLISTNQTVTTVSVMLLKTSQPVVYIPMELVSGYGTMFVALTDGSITYSGEPGDTVWAEADESNQEVMIPEIILQDETQGVKLCVEVKAANYDIKEIDIVGSEAAGELIFSRTVVPATGTPPIIPEPSYSISRFDLLKLARKLRQLNGTTNGMSVSEMGYAASRITVIEDAEGMVF